MELCFRNLFQNIENLQLRATSYSVICRIRYSMHRNASAAFPMIKMNVIIPNLCLVWEDEVELRSLIYAEQSKC
jgi:hypothetical protein